MVEKEYSRGRRHQTTLYVLCGFTGGIPWMSWVCQSYESAESRLEDYRKEYPRAVEVRITEVIETILYRETTL